MASFRSMLGVPPSTASTADSVLVIIDAQNEYAQGKLLISGVETSRVAHVCVSTTARQAAEKGWDVIVVEDAVGDRDIPGSKADEVKRVALNEIADAFGTIIQSKEIQ
ncbi:isochorismatase-like protein asqB [Colletotrichum liriopes]|uniref:Isochorismatase-like protein asqB n=1 Tax=Colletotrichum liriopes TaxID=708192 RepID=A0AA37GCZ1_9PEZI|nr:isochorismatase-like protein asqB [Colletotrichum liriopes]